MSHISDTVHITCLRVCCDIAFYSSLVSTATPIFFKASSGCYSMHDTSLNKADQGRRKHPPNPGLNMRHQRPKEYGSHNIIPYGGWLESAPIFILFW